MKPYLISAVVSAATVTLAIGLFVAGFFVRGWTSEGRPMPVGPGQTALPAAQTASAPTAVPAVSAPFVGNVGAADNPARGPEKALVTIVEFSDYQCPFCKKYFDETLPLVQATYGDRVRYVFRDFPIANIHPQAIKAAEAGQCAADQGRFWEYHDRLFQNQGALDVPNLKGHARTLGLDEGAFNACLDSGKYAEKVKKNFDDGVTSGVNGTPTFFINGRKVVGAQPFSVLQKVIDEELAKASGQ